MDGPNSGMLAFDTKNDVIKETLTTLADVGSFLRPVSTVGYHKGYQPQAFDFPTLYEVSPTFPVNLNDPVSSYAIDRNMRFAERYRNI